MNLTVTKLFVEKVAMLESVGSLLVSTLWFKALEGETGENWKARKRRPGANKKTSKNNNYHLMMMTRCKKLSGYDMFCEAQIALVSKLGIIPWTIATATGGPVSTSGKRSGKDECRT